MIRRGAVRRASDKREGNGKDEDEKERSSEAESSTEQEVVDNSETRHHLQPNAYVDKKVYENQLAKLQEQLEATLIEKLELQGNLTMNCVVKRNFI